MGCDRSIRDSGAGQLQVAQVLRRQWLADVRERRSRGEGGGHRREDVTAVEGPRHRLEALRRLADVHCVRHAAQATRGRHQQAVVRTDQDAALASAQRDRTTRLRPHRPDPRVHHRQVDTLGKERHRGRQHGGSGSDVVPGDRMAQVYDPRRRAPSGDDAVAHTDELVQQAVVGEERDDRRCWAVLCHRPLPLYGSALDGPILLVG